MLPKFVGLGNGHSEGENRGKACRLHGKVQEMSLKSDSDDLETG